MVEEEEVTGEHEASAAGESTEGEGDEGMRGLNDELDKCSLCGTTASAAVVTFALLLLGLAQLSLARTLSQTTFQTPEDASGALFAAVQKHDERALRQILGVGAQLVSSDDKIQDSLDRERKDLGPKTATDAGAMTTYHRDPSWVPAEPMS
jgi:hypothetical protein